MRHAGAKQLRQGAFRHAAEHRRNTHHAAGDIHPARKLAARRRHRTAQHRRPPPQSRGVGFQDPLVAGKGQRTRRLLQHLRGKSVFQGEESALPRPIAPGIFEAGGDEAFKAGTVAVLKDHVRAARHGHNGFRRFPRHPHQTARPQRNIAGRWQPSLRGGQRLQARERGSRTGAAANIGGGVREIGEAVEGEFGFEVHAHPPERELAFRAGIDEGKFQRALGPPIEVGIRGAGRNRHPIIAERGAQSVAVTDQMMQACNRAVLLRLDDVKLRAARWAHGSL